MSDNKKYEIAIYPGSMSIAKIVIDLFGLDQVDVGTWGGPVTVREVTDEDIEALNELLLELDKNLRIVKRVY